MPDWLFESLVRQYGVEETLALAAALNQPAPLDLRVNDLSRPNDAAVIARFAADGLGALAGEFSPGRSASTASRPWPGIPLRRRWRSRMRKPALGLLLAPRRGEMVVDFCAGAGGRPSSSVPSPEEHRQALCLRCFRPAPRQSEAAACPLGPVQRPSGRIEHERDPRVRRLAGKADRVLVDAPVSGPRHPAPQSRSQVAPGRSGDRRTDRQAEAILTAAATLVRPGGRLVYATCSLLAAENDAVVDGFPGRASRFPAASAGDILARQEIALEPTACGSSPPSWL